MKELIKKFLRENLEPCQKIKLTNEVIDYVNKFNTDEELLRAGGLAFGFSDQDIKTIYPKKLKIKWLDDLENVHYEVKKSGLSPINWSKKISLKTPIDVSYEFRNNNLDFYVEDGHHRYFAAMTLNKPLNVNLEIKASPLLYIGDGTISYDNFHRCIFKQVKNNLNEEIKASEAYTTLGAIDTLVNKKRCVGFISWPNQQMFNLMKDNDIEFIKVKDNPTNYVIYNRGCEKEALELSNIAKKYNGYLSPDATKEETIRIGQILGYSDSDIKSFIEKNFKEIINNLSENINNPHLTPVKVGRFLYHKSNPMFRETIKKEGLIPKGKSESWLSDTKINGKVIFATNSNNKHDWFDSTYDDDIYQIDTTNIKNKWFEDPNFSTDKEEWVEYNGKKIKLPKNKTEYKHVITFEPIPISVLKLIYQGTGENLD